jgi:cellulose synthase (UDP-forming)
MNPRSVLSLWRERWGKTSTASLKVPYARGKPNVLIKRLVNASFWTPVALSGASMAICMAALVFIATVRFPDHDQFVISAVLLALSLFLARYSGTFITLLLGAFSMVVSLRYFDWRVTETLGSSLTVEFALGFGLFAAEAYLFLLFGLRFLQGVWPMRCAAPPLPDDHKEWPYIDVLLLCHGKSIEEIRAAVVETLGIDWPKNKLKIHLVDSANRPDVAALSASVGVQYDAQAPGFSGIAGGIRYGMSKSHSELIVLLDCAYRVDKDFLGRTVGWFTRNHKLAIVQTPHHLLAPPPAPEAIALCGAQSAGSCAIVRRTMMMEAGVMEPAFDRQPDEIALAFHEWNYGTAYLCKDTPADQFNAAIPGLSVLPSPFSGPVLYAKERLAAAITMLEFYFPLARLVFFTAPAAYLLAGNDLVHASPDALALYALPHYLHGYIAYSRTRGPGRLALVTDLREALLAFYLLVPTGFGLLRTAVARLRQWWSRSRSGNEKELESDGMRNRVLPFSKRRAVAYTLIIGLNLAAFASGAITLRPEALQAADFDKGLAYLAWAGCNLLLLASLMAVAMEAREIRLHAESIKRMQLMMRLPLGRTISGSTLNFPATTLDIELPGPAAVKPGSELRISIFQGYREIAFTGTVLSQQENLLHVEVDPRMHAEYSEFATAAFSRPDNWPKWLPGRHADRPVPAWVTGSIMAVLIGILDFGTNPVQTMKSWPQMAKKLRFWKKDES